MSYVSSNASIRGALAAQRVPTPRRSGRATATAFDACIPCVRTLAASSHERTQLIQPVFQ
jgi:hypothetical protein